MFRKWLQVALLACTIAAAGQGVVANVAHAAERTTAIVGFLPEQSRYPRGQWITLDVLVKGADGAGVLQPGRVTLYYTSTRGRFPIQSNVATGPNGHARVSFQVPTNPNDDFVYINADYSDPLGSYAPCHASRRIPIG